MKALLLLLFALCAFSFTYLYKSKNNYHKIDEEARQKTLEYRQQFALGCSPNLNDIDFDDPDNSIPLLDGWGSYRMPVTAMNDSASIYFEQGINMYYGFHVIEAMASFDKATRFDSNFAMAYWGKALSYGPNINDYGYTASPEALTAMHKAKELAANCTPEEKGLIAAMQMRYTADTTETRVHLDQLYADEMKKLHQQFAASEDIAALYADALMVQHPWDFYDAAGKAKAWTPELVQTLEAILKQNPVHPGAAHYYIHAVEASDHPEIGLAVARRLTSLMPGVSHLVHMPSHIFIRSGYYKEGVDANAQSVKGYYNYLKNYAPVANNSALYLIHNLHMEAACANTDGNYKIAMQSSIDCQHSFDSSWMTMPGYFGVFVQYVYMTPLLTDIRFGKWDAILNSAAIPDSLVFANLLWHYGRGMAYARKHDVANAANELQQLQSKLPNEQLKAEAPVYANEGIKAAVVAEALLQGAIAEAQNDLPKATAYYQEAVKREDAMKYNEPRDWVHPTRQYLSNVYIKTKHYADAEKVFKEDLFTNPNNGWSLTGLAMALEKQHKKSQAVAAKKAAQKAFADSDVKITASVF